jgi:hypothetical protein
MGQTYSNHHRYQALSAENSPSANVLLNVLAWPARKDAANRNLLRQNFIAYIFRSKSAREQERKSSSAYIFRSQSARVQERKSSIAYIFRSKKQEPEQEREWRNPVPF